MIALDHVIAGARTFNGAHENARKGLLRLQYGVIRRNAGLLLS